MTVKASKKEWRLEAGIYVYVGSAMGGLTGRVKRHLTSGDKKLYWHIDYLRERAEIIMAVLLPSRRKMEEELSELIGSKGEVINGFGSSDCKTKGNLYRIEEIHLEGLMKELIKGWRGEYDWFFD